jgi:streptomycin 6-kinase
MQRIRKSAMRDDELPTVTLHNGFVLPDELKRRMLWGGKDQGIHWLERAPSIVRDWCDRWNITLEPEVPTLSYNLVLFGTSPEQGQVVLKLAPPHEEVRSEVEATRAANGPGLVRLIAADPEVSIMIMERVRPGIPLKAHTDSGAISDEEATRIAASEMKKMWVAPPEGHHLFPLDRWFQALFSYHEAHPDGGGPLDNHLVELAVEQARDLLATQREIVVLHGDVHHDNILADDTYGWTLIDYKGLVGERGYDIGTWMLNPYGEVGSWPNPREVMDRRLDIFAEELQIERDRLWQWSMVHSVLSICWTLEGGVENWDGDVAVARIMAEKNPFRD